MTGEEEGAYYQGFIAGLYAYAWMKDGKTYVGSCGRLLSEAVKYAKETFNYRKEAK